MLLEGNLSSCLFDLCLEFVGFVLSYVLLEDRRYAVHKILCLLEAKAEYFLHRLDDRGLVGSGIHKLDGHSGLLLLAACSPRCGTSYGYGCCRYAELLFEDLHEFIEFHDAHLLDLVDEFLELRGNLYLSLGSRRFLLLLLGFGSGLGTLFLLYFVCHVSVLNVLITHSSLSRLRSRL